MEWTEKDFEQYQYYLDKMEGDEQEANKLWVRWKCLTDLYYLGSEVIGLKDAIDPDNGRHRLDPEFHGDIANLLNVDEDILLLVQRGAMKSAWAKIKIVQLILRRPNIRIGLFSRTAGLAIGQLSEIKVHFSNPILIEHFPDVIPDPGKKYRGWHRSTNEELTLCRNEDWGRIPQENQIEVWGTDATITGRHYDAIVLDDVINEKSCKTIEQIAKQHEFHSMLQPIKEPGGLEITIGTKYHHNDIYATIIDENYYGDRVYIKSCWQGDGVTPTYKYFTKKMLMKLKRRMTRFNWSCQYENNPIPSEDQVFPPPQPTYDILPQDYYEFYMTVDPAATTEAYSDETAISIGAVNNQGQMYIPEAKGYKIKPDKIADKIIEKCLKYKVRKCGIEVGMQTGLKYILSVKIQEWEGQTGKTWMTKFIDIKPPRNISKADRINQSLGSFARDGKLFIQEDNVELMDQMSFFPKAKHDDIIDATAMLLAVVGKLSVEYYEHVVKPRSVTYKDVYFTKPRKSNAWGSKFAS